MEKYVFWPMAVLALLSGLGMVMARNAVHSALMLVLNFFSLAVFYVLLEAHFLAAVQIIVYAGAIMVLFLFVVMLVGVHREEPQNEPLRLQRPLAYVFGIGLGVFLIFVLRTAFATAQFTDLDKAQASGNAQAVGRLLFSKYIFPFEVTSLLLIVAAIGVIVMGRRAVDDESEPVPEDAPSLPVLEEQPAPIGGAE